MSIPPQGAERKALPLKTEQEQRECGEPLDDGSGRVCRRICPPGRDYHGGGHWYAAPDLDGDYVRHATATWIVTGKTPEKSA